MHTLGRPTFFLINFLLFTWIRQNIENRQYLVNITAIGVIFIIWQNLQLLFLFCDPSKTAFDNQKSVAKIHLCVWLFHSSKYGQPKTWTDNHNVWLSMGEPIIFPGVLLLPWQHKHPITIKMWEMHEKQILNQKFVYA